MFELTTEQIELMRDAAREAGLAAAQAFGFGGDTWAVTRTSGDGVTSDTVQAPAASVTGYAYRARPGGNTAALAQAPALDDKWYFILLSGTLHVRDVLTSAADGRRLAVTSIEPWYEYSRCEVERDRQQ